MVKPSFSQERFVIKKVGDYYVVTDTEAGIELLGLNDLQATHYYTLFKRMERCSTMLQSCNSLDSASTKMIFSQGKEIVEKDIYIAQLEALYAKFEKALKESEKLRRKMKKKKLLNSILHRSEGILIGAAAAIILTR